MKTYTIKTPTAELLIVELPEDTQFDVLVDNPLWKDGIKFLTGPEQKFHFIKGHYTLLGFIRLFEDGETIKSDNTETLVNALDQIEKLKADNEELLEAKRLLKKCWEIIPLDSRKWNDVFLEVDEFLKK